MAALQATKVAMMPDPHFRDLTRGPVGWPRSMPVVRSLRDSVSSLRIANESGFALRAALDEVVRRDIRIVVMPGDLTEDGQVCDLDGFIEITREYSKREGLMFFAAFGNHDAYGMTGRHLSKAYIGPDGRTVSVSSRQPADFVDPAFFVPDYAAMMNALRDFGFFRQPHFLHWETPFGADDTLAARTYRIMSDDGRNRCEAIDSSYLVEPSPGLWLLVLDSNVYQPKTGHVDVTSADAFIDGKDGKWCAVVRHRGYLLDWMADVRRRADALGKTLLACSHYAMLPLSGPHPASPEEGTSAQTAARLAGTGIGLHFSGHAHVSSSSRWTGSEGNLIDVAVPALCSFPPAFQVIEATPQGLGLETVLIKNAPDFDVTFDAYRREASCDPDLALVADNLTATADYDIFISRQLEWAVGRVLARKHFGAAFAGLAHSQTVAACLVLAGIEAPAQTHEITLMQAVCDWYRLSRGGAETLAYVPSIRLPAYTSAARSLAMTTATDDAVWEQARSLILELGAMAESRYPRPY